MQAPARATAVLVIPARYASTRLPAKPLADINGKPMIQWVYERCKQVKSATKVIVATDHPEIEAAVRRFGGEVMMTSPDLPSGTDRVAAVADRIHSEIYVNVQGDEPLIDPEDIERAIDLIARKKFEMGTLMCSLRSEAELDNPTVVKVIADKNGRAIYFSRLPIPYSRGPRPTNPSNYSCLRHIGLYSYTRDALMQIRSLPPSALEKAEVLEQLRALDAGIAIGVARVETLSMGVDTPEDLEKVRGILV